MFYSSRATICYRAPEDRNKEKFHSSGAAHKGTALAKNISPLRGEDEQGHSSLVTFSAQSTCLEVREPTHAFPTPAARWSVA
jgi:hypothetical protein